MKLFSTLCLFTIVFIGFSQTPTATSIIAHKVEANQTLYAIGRLYHVSPQVLMKNNPQYGPNFYLITGSIVKVPSAEAKSANVNEITPQQIAPKPKSNTSSPAVAVATPSIISPTKSLNNQEKYAKFSTHIVRSGETIESIAAEEQVSPTDLIALNKTKIAHLKAGDVIFIKEYWLPIENSPSASIQHINKEDAILSTLNKEKYDNELLFMNENR